VSEYWHTEWQNSAVLQGELVTEVRKRKQARDIVITGSASVIHTLAAHGEVDEYRLVVFPLVLGEGTRLFPDRTAPVSLALGIGPDRRSRCPPDLYPRHR
jgi:dihydrofolate reductase